MIISIYAEDLNHHIGYNNKMPWFIPKDLHYFKKITLGNYVLMGRKTFESLNKIPLPGRKNIVLTKNKNYNVPKDVIILNSKEEVLKFYEKNKTKKMFIIGGKEIFSLFLENSDYIYRTKIEKIYQADTQVSEINKAKFILIRQTFVPVSSQNEAALIFEIWKKII